MIHIRDLTNRLFLWHLSPRPRADRITVQGFIPKGEPRQNHIGQAIWFLSSGYSFVERVQGQENLDDYDGFLIAVPVDSLDDTFNGQVTEEFTAFQPIPPETILCRFPAGQATDRHRLLSMLQTSLCEDIIDQLVLLCTREDIPWSQRTSAAATLAYLDRNRYDTEGITALAMADSLPSRSLAECVELSRSLAMIDFRFYDYFLRQYYYTYGERHIARAFLTAAARRIGDQVVTLCCDQNADSGHNHVARFIADLLPAIPERDLVFALMELAVMRPRRLSPETIERLESWLYNHPIAVSLAPWFIEHARDTFHARLIEQAVDLAARILSQSESAYSEISNIEKSPFPDSRLGAVRAYGVLREVRALPFLESCLDTDWKAMREEAVRSLSTLDSARARTLVEAATNDRAGRIRRTAIDLIKNLDR